MSLSISVQNFGPIAEGTVDLKPFTVFIGPNNTGKSFFSELIYAAHVYSRGRDTLPSRFRLPPRGSRLSSKLFNQAAMVLRQQLENAEDPRRLLSSLPEEQQRFLMDAVLADLDIYARSLVSELERCLGGELSELIRVTDAGTARSQMRLTIRDRNLGWGVQIQADKEGSKHRVNQCPSIEALIALADRSVYETLESFIDIEAGSNDSEIPSPLRLSGTMSEEIASFATSRLFDELHHNLFDTLPPNRHYLPAARSGIMQSHKTLAAFLIRSAPLVGLQRMEVPQLSGIVTDFIGQLLSLETRRKQSALSRVADHLEASILHGKIVVRTKPDVYPEILYRVGNLEAPLVRLSSMISELAPVVLYLRYVLRARDLLIIEEPEAHLHPQSQLEFARALARLRMEGIHIALTTHSDYLLTELNNLIRESTAAATNDKISPDLQLPPDQVGAYLFEPRPGGRGTVITELKVSPVEGIPDEEFGRVTETIYDQAAALQYRLLNSGVQHEDD